MMTARRVFGLPVRLLVRLTVVIAAMGASSVPAAPPLVVAKDGVPAMTIVVGRQCPAPSRFAAEELSKTLQQITGAPWDIRTDRETLPGAVLAIGPPEENSSSARLLREAGVDLAALDLGEEEILLRSVGGNMVVCGGSPRANLYAVYALLEQLGCRWCFPGPHGAVIPQAKTVELPSLNRVEKPGLSYRTFLQLEVVGEETVDWVDWMAKNRMNTMMITLYPAKTYKGQLYAQFKKTPGLVEAFQKRGMRIEAGNHASFYWVPPSEFFATRPEFYSRIAGKPHTLEKLLRDQGQLCFSNAEVAEVTAQRVIAFARENPEVDLLGIYTNDGYGYCECEGCRKLGSPSDAYCTYVNRVAEQVYEALPGKKLAFLSYSTVRDPPKVKVFSKNTLCAIATWPPPDENRLKGWLASGVKDVALYEYYMGSYSDSSIPWVNTRAIADELKLIHRLGLAGVASQCELKNWGAYGLNYWIYARLAWNPALGLEEVLDDYFRHYYAEAAGPMSEYFRFLESLGRMSRDLNVPSASIDTLQRLLAAGEKAAASEAVIARIRRDRIALDYLKLAWSVQDAQRKARALHEQAKLGDAVDELTRAERAAEACLEHLHRYRDQRVFLMGRPNEPSEIVGHYYTTAFHERNLAKIRETLAATRRLAAAGPGSVNLACGKRILAQTAYSEYCRAEKAVDGDLASAWYSGYHRNDPSTAHAKLPQSLQVDLGTAATIGCVVLRTPQQVYRYTIDVSADGQAWSKVAAKSDGKTGSLAPGLVHVFEPVNARYVRLTVTDNPKQAAHVHELEVYEKGPPDQPPATPTKTAKTAPPKRPAAPAAPQEVKDRFVAHLAQRVRQYPATQIGAEFPPSREAWLAHAERLRKELRAIFAFPAEDVPLDAKVVGTIDRGDFIIEKVVYRTEADSRVTALVYVPKGLSGPLPAIVLPSGHGGSKSAPYNQYFGQMYAKAGCVVLAPDPIGEEERDEKGRLAIRGHRLDGRIDRAFGLGTSVIGKLVYDVVRGIDYLVSRPEVDARRIGCASHSLGGTLTQYVTAVDPRVRVSLVTAWTCNFHEIIDGPSCCWRPPALLRTANDPELFGLGAPHCATLVLAGGNDACPMHVDRFTATTLPKAKQVFGLFGREDCLAVHVTPDAGHQPFQLNRAALAWVEKHLDLPRLSPADVEKLPDHPPPAEVLTAELTGPFEDSSWAVGRINAARAAYGDVRLLPFNALRCLKPGEEAGPEFGMAGWMAAREARLAARFSMPADAAAWQARAGVVRQKLLALLDLPPHDGGGRVETLKSFPHGKAQGYQLRYGLLGLSSYLLMPEGVAHAPVVIYLPRSRSKKEALASPRVGELLGEGRAVLALDAVPFVETAFLLGTSPTAYNVAHVLESLDALAKVGDLDLTHVAVWGEVDDVALLAAIADRRITEVVVASAGGAPVAGQGYRLNGVVPGLRALATRGELLALIAPRPLRIESAESEQTQVEAVYRLLGASERLRFVVP